MKDKPKRKLTLDDLLAFCDNQRFEKFSSENEGYQIAVAIPAIYEVDENASRRGLLSLRIKVAHIGLNRNHVYVSEEALKNAAPSIKNRPLLASIHQFEDETWDFGGHEITTDDDGEDVYIEKQIGSFTEENAIFEKDEETGNVFLVAKAVVPEEYTKAAEIIRAKGGSKNSCEFSIDEFVYNAKEKCIEITDFYFKGSTLLGKREDGTQIGEGMLGSRADIIEFSAENNSSFIELSNKIDTVLSLLSAEETKKRGDTMDKLTELLAKYSKTQEDITFETEGLTDEDLETKFEEVFGEKESFEMSLQDKIQAIFDLANVTYGDVDNDYYCCTVFDEYVIMYGYYANKYFKQGYSVDGDTIQFTGEREPVFAEFVTEDEKKKLDEIRCNYEELLQFKENIEKNELNEKKMNILSNPKFSVLEKNEKFTELRDNMDNYSVEELETKTKVIFSEYVLSGGTLNFSEENTEPKQKKTEKKRVIFAQNEDKETSAYGSIFKDVRK